MPPAARISDMHSCPTRPHVGGPILAGEKTVIIGNMPAARVGDSAKCNGPTDAVAEGEPSVIIGGQSAARIGDRMVHGGVIVAGCQTVIIGSTPQGDTLEAAARNAVPFCEECERQRREEEGEEPQEPGRGAGGEEA
ncbi:MAG TPA: PAAR domain-containing protein [Polyangiaceae bacterium]|nr:PAAR domain-containing protein [Polyangiaceae bacterium]